MSKGDPPCNRTAFVLASRGRRLAGSLAFQLFDPFLQMLDNFAELLVFRAKPGVFRLEFLDALVASVGVHAILPSPRLHVMILRVCAMKAQGASTELLHGGARKAR